MMDSKTKERIRQIEGAIREILLRRWDPIGVAEEPAAQDEYDGYIGGIYRLIASGAGSAAIAEHLAAIERDQMGFRDATAAERLHVASELAQLNVAL
jgi:hypothetical protein